MTHFARTCDVIGHDVMVEPDISNERARAVLYDIKVSWSKLYWIRICSQFISAKYCHFLAKISKRPKISRKRAEDGTLKNFRSTTFYGPETFINVEPPLELGRHILSALFIGESATIVQDDTGQ